MGTWDPAGGLPRTPGARAARGGSGRRAPRPGCVGRFHCGTARRTTAPPRLRARFSRTQRTRCEARRSAPESVRRIPNMSNDPDNNAGRLGRRSIGTESCFRQSTPSPVPDPTRPNHASGNPCRLPPRATDPESRLPAVPPLRRRPRATRPAACGPAVPPLRSSPPEVRLPQSPAAPPPLPSFASRSIASRSMPPAVTRSR